MTRPLSIGPAVKVAYGDVWRLLRDMRTFMICVLFLVLAIAAAEGLIPKAWSGSPLGHLLGFAVNVIGLFLLTPFMIAIHRFILRDEIARGYEFNPGQPGFMAYFGWLVALSGIGTLPLLLQDGLTAVGLPPAVGFAVVVVLTVLATIFSLRLSILFPAIAIDAPGANMANALADTKGHAFKILLVLLLAFLPWLLVTITLMALVLLGIGKPAAGPLATMTTLVLIALMQILTLCLSVAITSRLFQALADRVLRAA